MPGFCLIGALYYYLKIAKLLWTKTTGSQAVLLFAAFPTEIFLFAVYSESLFAFAALAAVYYCLRKRYALATLSAAAATATHADGLFVVLLIGVMALFEHRQAVWKAAVMMAAGCSGLVAYMAYLWVRFDNPLQFVRSEQYWCRLQGNYLQQLITTSTLFNLIGLR